MIGRASRTRGVSEGIMFSVGNEKASQVVQKLKRAKATQLMELEELVLELEAKCKIKNVINKMKQLTFTSLTHPAILIQLNKQEHRLLPLKILFRFRKLLKKSCFLLNIKKKTTKNSMT